MLKPPLQWRFQTFVDICCQVPLLTARSRLDMGEEKIANEIDDYFRCSSRLSYWDETKFLFRDQLIYKRNKRMGARVIELLLNNPGRSRSFLFCTFIQETFSFSFLNTFSSDDMLPRPVVLLCLWCRPLCR